MALFRRGQPTPWRAPGGLVVCATKVGYILMTTDGPGLERKFAAKRQRWAIDQVICATFVDEAVAHAFSTVAFMLAHPFCLGDPALVKRAVAANQRPLSPEPRGF
jgi:hypothetical protein